MFTVQFWFTGHTGWEGPTVTYPVTTPWMLAPVVVEEVGVAFPFWVKVT
jgi:hypothetical protein